MEDFPGIHRSLSLAADIARGRSIARDGTRLTNKVRARVADRLDSYLDSLRLATANSVRKFRAKQKFEKATADARKALED